MEVGRRRTVAAAAVAGLLLAPGLARAESPVERAAERQEVEQRIQVLGERLAAVPPLDKQALRDKVMAGERVDWVVVLSGDMARRHLKLARRALDSGNERAAMALSDLAEKDAERAAGKKEVRP
jgi:hypothetical protein